MVFNNLFTLSIQHTHTHTHVVMRTHRPLHAHTDMFPSRCLSPHCGLKNKFMHRVIIGTDKSEYVGFFLLFQME